MCVIGCSFRFHLTFPSGCRLQLIRNTTFELIKTLICPERMPLLFLSVSVQRRFFLHFISFASPLLNHKEGWAKLQEVWPQGVSVLESLRKDLQPHLLRNEKLIGVGARYHILLANHSSLDARFHVGKSQPITAAKLQPITGSRG